MSILYRYIDKNTKEIVYIGITGTKGRESSEESVKKRMIEHFTQPWDPLFQSEYYPKDLIVEYCMGLTVADAVALEILAINYYNPKYNTYNNYISDTLLWDSIHLNWNILNDLPNCSKSKKIDRRSNGKTKGRVLSNGEIQKIYNTVKSADVSFAKERDWCIIAVLLYTGCRLSDVVNLNDLDINNGEIMFNRTGEIIKINEQLRKAITEYRNIKKNYIKNHDRVPFFVSSQNKRISPKTIQWILQKVGNVSGIENLTAATLKKTYERLVREAMQVVQM